MASGAKISNPNYQPSSKLGAFQSSASNMESSQDLHIKMSKKIAQLTKVIYALNTRNDENETVIQALKEQHEEEVQQVMEETKQKLELFKDKVEEESKKSCQIAEMEKTLKSFEMEKEKALLAFEEYRNSAQAREAQLKSEYTQKVSAFSNEVSLTKMKLEDKIYQLDTFQKRLEKEKFDALEEMMEKHRRELDEALEAERSKQGSLKADTANMQKELSAKLAALQEKLDLQEEERKRIEEEYEGKLQKAQAFYEKELEALKSSNLLEEESTISTLRDELERVKKDAQFQEKTLKAKIQSLLEQLSQYEEDLEKSKQDLKILQNSMEDKNSTTSVLHSQLQRAREDAESAFNQLKAKEAELLAARQRCEYQAQDIMSKSGAITELEAAKMQQETVIQELVEQVSKLTDRVSMLEGVKRALEAQNQTQNQEQLKLVKHLEKELEDMTIEKQTWQQRYEQEVQSLEEQARFQEAKLKEEHQRDLKLLEERLTKSSSLSAQELQIQMEEMRMAFENQLATETTRLEQERDAIQANYDLVKANLEAQLEKANAELEILRNTLSEREQGLGSVTTQVSTLKEAHDRIRQELERAQSQLKTSQAKCSELQNELDRMKELHEKTIKEHETELRERLESLSKELGEKWSRTVADETMKLRHDFQQQREEDKRVIMNELMKAKAEEIAALKKSWENKLQDLLQENSSLKGSLGQHEKQWQKEREDLLKSSQSAYGQLEEELRNAQDEAARKIAALEENYRQQFKQLYDNHAREMSSIEDRLRAEHVQEIQNEMQAHRLAVQSVKDKMEKANIQQIEDLKADFENRRVEIEEEIEQKFSYRLEELNMAHGQQLAAARMELERALELSKHKESEATIRLGEMNEKILQRDAAIRGLEGEVSTAETSIHQLTDQLQNKRQELEDAQAEARKKFLAHDEKLKAKHEQEKRDLSTDFENTRQGMMTEFQQAQAVLKNRIDELENMLSEALERYERRESRPEDLETIDKLHQAIQEREEFLKKLDEEKRYFQRELVNRETNFNKIFNSDPKVGVINPLNSKKSKVQQRGDVPPRSFNGSPASSGHQKLEPIPGLPLHDKLNPHNPIPPMKKFIK